MRVRFETDDEELSITITLEAAEAPGVDLRDGLGDRLLDAIADEIRRSCDAQEAPSGQPWDELKPATARRKGSALIGVHSGRMLSEKSLAGTRDIGERAATWTYSGPSGQAHGFHNGNPRNACPARPFVGVSPRAEARCATLIA